MTRIGILGGTFDPPHIAHLIAGECAASEFELDKLLYIPANIPPNKSAQVITPAADRLAMTRLAIEGNSRFDVSEIELKRKGPSYTIDTIREVKSKFNIPELYLFVGLDQLLNFMSWHNPQDILDEANVVVMARPTKELKEIDSNLKDRVKFMLMPMFDISSTDIRSSVRAGDSIRYLVPPAVEAYICDHRLYRSNKSSEDCPK